MKRETTTKKSDKLLEFLKDFMEQVNNNIHNDLELSQDYLAKHELDDYLDDDGALIGDIEANEDLTVRDVFQLGVNFARTELHQNWHKAMEKIAKKHGVSKAEMEASHGHGVHVVSDPSELPDDVQQLLAEALGLGDLYKQAKRKKGKK